MYQPYNLSAKVYQGLLVFDEKKCRSFSELE
jgi:hypothetical protein